MQFFKNMFIILIVFFSTQIAAKHESTLNEFNQASKNAIHRHHPLEIDFKKIINPTKIKISNEKALNEPLEKIAPEDKRKKYDSDKELRAILKDHAYGLSEGNIFTRKQGLNFFNLSIHEQINQLNKWLKDHNTHQRDMLKKAQHDYDKELAKFKADEQQKALETVQSIEDSIKTRNNKIESLSKKLEKLEEHRMKYQQKQEEISRLTQENNVAQASIEKHLLPIIENLEKIDANFKEKCEEIIKSYQTGNHQILNTVNGLVLSKKQSFSLKTADKKMPKESDQKSQSKALKHQTSSQNSDSVILSESIESLANNPLLNTIVDQTHKDIARTSKSSDEYATLKKELAHLKKAQHQRDIQQKPMRA